MACRKAFDLDLVACLLDAGRPEWSEFREHYPRCPECAAEVRTWTELQASLAPPHPDPEDLVRFESRANDMPPEERRAVAAHIATCRSCRDELRALRAFDPATVAGPEAVRATPRPRWWNPARIVLHPAFAYGVALAFAVPLLARLLPPRAEPAAVAPQVAQPQRPLLERGAREKTRSRVLQYAGKDEAAAPAAPPPATAPAALATSAPPEARADAAEELPASARESPDERAAAADTGWRVVVLSPVREAEIAMPAGGLVLRLAPPRSQPALPAGLAWMRVRDAAGRRELREQQFGNPGSSAELRVPAAWLEPGSYRADLLLGDDNRPLTVARFRVEP
jgi:hypothetical protein